MSEHRPKRRSFGTSGPGSRNRGDRYSSSARFADPETLGSTLERFLKHMGAPPARTLTNLEGCWHEIVGPALAERTRPIEVIDGVLVIGCDDANWGSQIGWMDAQIKERFAATFEGAEIRRIQLKMGP